MSRIRQTKNNINGFINGSACVVPSDVAIVSAGAQMTSLQAKKHSLNDLKSRFVALDGNVGYCWGAKLSKWYERYHNVQKNGITIGDNWICEQKFVLQVIAISGTMIMSINDQIKSLETRIDSLQKTFSEDTISYEDCLKLSTAQQTAVATATAQEKELTTAETEQLAEISINKMNEQEQTNKQLNMYLPYVFGAVGVGGAIYFATRKKRR